MASVFVSAGPVPAGDGAVFCVGPGVGLPVPPEAVSLETISGRVSSLAANEVSTPVGVLFDVAGNAVSDGALSTGFTGAGTEVCSGVGGAAGADGDVAGVVDAGVDVDAVEAGVADAGAPAAGGA